MEDFDLTYFMALRRASFGRAASLAQLLAANPPNDLQAVAYAAGLDVMPHWRTALKEVAALRALQVSTVPVWQLPARLRRAVPMPLALFVRGDPLLLHSTGVSIVGARRASDSGKRWAAALARQHAAAGMLVVSGGALGIDGAAHAGALQGGGCTLAYLGCAIDQIYPAPHRNLFTAILRGGGALVSEHPPGADGLAWHHAARNRFIAAHGGVLVVAEAAEQSGSLGTAAAARRLGGEIWVSPEGVAKQRGGVVYLLARGWAQVCPMSLG